MLDAATNLREKQKPLKDKYRSDPASALVTLSTSGTLDSGLSCSLSTASAAKKVAGLHAAAGGRGFDASGELCSGDMLLESLVACFGVTIKAVATSMGIPLEGGSVVCSGDLDFRGTLGIKDESGNPVAVGFKNIRLTTTLDVAEEHKKSVEKLLELSERYCVVLQSLRAGVTVETSLAHGGKHSPDAKKDKDANDSNAELAQTLSNEEVIRLN